MATFDERLISRFEWLRHWTRDAIATPPIFMAFDVLRLESRDLHNEPPSARRKILESLVEGQRLLLPARTLKGDGLEAWAEVKQRGYEGSVAKDEDSLYVGARALSAMRAPALSSMEPS